MLTVNFRTSSGIVTSRKFPKNTGVSIYGKSVTSSGIGINPGSKVSLRIDTSDGVNIYYKETYTDFFGDYSFYFITPNIDQKLDCRFFVDYLISGQEEVVIPIAVGNLNPDPVPYPKDKPDWLTIVVIGFLGVGLISVLKR